MADTLAVKDSISINEETEAARWTRIFLSEPKAARITPELVESALQGFALEPLRDTAWLARAIQPAVYLAAKADYPAEQGNARTRDELDRLAKHASDLWLEVFEMSNEARDAIDRYIWSPWIEGRGGALESDIKDQYEALDAALRHLNWQAGFLRNAANHVGSKKQASKWKSAAMKDWRMWFAVWLSPAFKKGFGRKPGLSKVSASNAWGRRKTTKPSLGNWADFYQRIMAAAFGEKATPNLAAVLEEALKRGMPSFEPGIFPD